MRRRFKRKFKRRVKRRRPSRVRFALKAARMPRRMARFSRMLNSVAEKKVYNYTGLMGISFNIGPTGFYQSVSFPTQGTARDQRVGNRIFVRYIIVKFILFGGGSAERLVRISLVWPKRSDFANVVECPLTDEIQPWDLDKFTVIKDRVIRFTLNSSTNTNPNGLDQVFRFKLKVMKSFNFNDASTTPDETFPAMFFWNGAIGSPYPALTSWVCTTTYTDV